MNDKSLVDQIIEVLPQLQCKKCEYPDCRSYAQSLIDKKEKTNKSYCIVHSIDGYDEVSLTGSFKLFSNNQDLMLEPKDLGFNVIDSVKLSGGKNIKESSKIFLDILGSAKFAVPI